MTEKQIKTHSASECQRIYCQEYGFPWVAPIKCCPRCGFDIYDSEKGYTKEQAATQMITSCPHCHYSFVE